MNPAAMAFAALLLNSSLSTSFFKKPSLYDMSSIREPTIRCLQWVPHIKDKTLTWFRDNKQTILAPCRVENVNELIMNDPYIALTFVVM